MRNLLLLHSGHASASSSRASRLLPIPAAGGTRETLFFACNCKSACVRVLAGPVRILVKKTRRRPAAADRTAAAARLEQTRRQRPLEVSNAQTDRRAGPTDRDTCMKRERNCLRFLSLSFLPRGSGVFCEAKKNPLSFSLRSCVRVQSP